MRHRSEQFLGIFRFLSLLKWCRKDRGSWQPNTHARAKVPLIKVGESSFRRGVESLYRF